MENLQDLKYELQLIRINIEYIKAILDIIIKHQFIAEEMRDEIKARYNEVEERFRKMIKDWAYTIE